MAITLETGTGVPGANSYILPAFVTNYLTDLNRLTENMWSTRTATEQEAACIAATQYIDTRWGPRFKGSRSVVFFGEAARARLTVSGQPTAGDTLIVSLQTYTFVTTLDSFNTNEIEIGDNVAETIQNIIDAINEDFEVAATPWQDTMDQILLTQEAPGVSGNDTPLNADAATNITVTNAFSNGVDSGSQPLEFPRAGLIDDSGRRVLGIPLRLKQAASEYAVRALAAQLFQDPVTDNTGRIVQEKTERVGPLEESVVYSEGATLEQLIKPYPAADRLLLEFVTGRTVIR